MLMSHDKKSHWWTPKPLEPAGASVAADTVDGARTSDWRGPRAQRDGRPSEPIAMRATAPTTQGAHDGPGTTWPSGWRIDTARKYAGTSSILILSIMIGRTWRAGFGHRRLAMLNSLNVKRFGATDCCEIRK